MGRRFRKTIKISKGVRVNISKSGMSLSLGRKGHTVNVSSKGVRQNSSIFGSGFNTCSPKATTSNHHSASQGSHSEIQMKMNSDGKISFLYENGTIITDEAVIRRIKATDSYKSVKAELDKQRKQKLEQIYEESHTEINKLISIYQLAQKIEPESCFVELLDSLEPEKYIISDYPIPAPEQEDIRAELLKEAKQTVKGNIFKRSKLRKQYVADHFDSRYKEASSGWEKGRDAYMLKEKELAVSENAKFQKEYEMQKSHFEAIIRGDAEAVGESIDKWIATCELPVEVDISYNYDSDKGEVFLDIDLPDITIIPTKELVKLESGNLREKNKTQLKIKQEYQKMVLGLAMVVTSGVFNVSPAIKKVVASGYNIIQKEAEAKEEYIYSIIFDRKLFANFQRDAEPISFCAKFTNRMNVTASAIMRRIIPFESIE